MTAAVSHGQVLASMSGFTHLTTINNIVNNNLTYEVMEASEGIQLEGINYSKETQSLTIDAVQEVSSISVYKDGEVYLKYMPVFSESLTLSTKNYEQGNYELHLITSNVDAPAIIKIEKR